jgi:hypothetical protein
MQSRALATSRRCTNVHEGGEAQLRLVLQLLQDSRPTLGPALRAEANKAAWQMLISPGCRGTAQPLRHVYQSASSSGWICFGEFPHAAAQPRFHLSDTSFPTSRWIAIFGVILKSYGQHIRCVENPEEPASAKPHHLLLSHVASLTTKSLCMFSLHDQLA